MIRRAPSDRAPVKSPNSAQDQRRERQAEALRENLKRRKEQQRARDAHSEVANDD